MNHGSLFSGIGGWSVASDEMGWETAFMCEWDENKQYVLKSLWKNAIIYGDISATDFAIWKGRIDILTASTPCQPFSLAGKREGANDVRHLWPETYRAIREIQPPWFVLENVPGLVNWSNGMVFKQIITDLENEGYEVLPFLLPACGVNAPHKRERIWIVAYSDSYGYELRGFGKNRQTQGKSISKQEQWERIRSNSRGISQSRIVTNTRNEGCKRNELTGINAGENKKRREGISGAITELHSGSNWSSFPTVSPLRTGDDGFSRDALRSFINENSGGLLTEKEVDQIIQKSLNKWNNETIAAGGDAVVVQVVFQIFKAIDQFNNQLTIKP
jgi:DNA-cytosine methyltransferase